MSGIAKRHVRRTPVRLGPGDARSFSVASVGLSFHSELEDRTLLLPWSFERFEDAKTSPEVCVVVRSTPRLTARERRLLFDSSLHWRAFETTEGVEFELFHPPSGQVYCRMELDGGFSRAEITYAEEPWLAIGAARREWLLPHPLDQLLLVPALALRGVVLLHACGAVLEDRALVFAGHSGDGKTTLAGLLGSEGATLLSDERIALRRTPSGFVAYGTPWPGEGRIVSPENHPLSALFVLRKAERHSLSRSSARSLVPELLARAIVPYYLSEAAARILGIFDQLVREVVVSELHFARQPGLRSLLQAA